MVSRVAEKLEPLNGAAQDVVGDGMRTIPHKMKFRAVMMTPTVAAELLKHKHPRQRKAKDSRINLYAYDIAADYWELTHQAVAVDEDGWLIDGQNRLEAIILADKAAPILLITGAPKRSMRSLDMGLGRSVADAAKVDGVELPYGANAFTAVAKAMIYGVKPRRTTPSHKWVLDFIESHRKALVFAFEVLPRNERLVTQAPVRAAVARAYYRSPANETRARLKEFGEVLATGLPEKPLPDSGAIRLRKWLTDEFSGRRGVGIRPRSEVVYAKAQNAIDSFLKREPVQQLSATKQELFPLPGEECTEC